MDKQQIKEFWEWCGLTLIQHTDRYSSGTQNWIEYQQNGKRIDEPRLDLNNLFKYAVPKLKESSLPWKKMFVDWVHAVLYEDVDPALALFWAIWEVIHND